MAGGGVEDRIKANFPSNRSRSSAEQDIDEEKEKTGGRAGFEDS